MIAITPRPIALKVHPENIPAELIDHDRWVVWRYHPTDTGWTKVPFQARHPDWKASTTNPATWSTFADALWTYQRGQSDGIGFVITPTDAFVGGDVDHCIDAVTGQIDEEAAATVSQVPTYWEVSAGGKGLHFFAHGTFEGRGRKVGPHEMYKESRFFTITGHHLEGTPGDIREAQLAIDALYSAWFPDPAPKNESHAGQTVPVSSDVANDLSDDEILRLAAGARNGGKFTRLLKGCISDYGDDASRADAGLAGILAFYTTDASQIERLMRQSGLVRDKWDKHRTYLERTIQGAIAKVTECYHRPLPLPAAPTSAPSVAFHHETRPETAGCLDLVAENDQLKATIHDLRDQLTQRDATIARLEAEVAELVGLQRRTAAAMRNAPMKALTPVAIPLAHTIAAARRTNPSETGPVRLYLPDMAHAAGRSKATVSRALVELEEYGLITRQEETEHKWISDDRTREMRPIDVTRLSVDLKGTPEQFLDAIATFTPAKAPHGGFRVRCPHHPDADVIEQHICSACGEILSQKTVKSVAFHDETGLIEKSEEPGSSATATTPIQTATYSSVALPSVAFCKTPLNIDAKPSLLTPACPKCMTPAARQGEGFVDDLGRGRFVCPRCDHLFLAPLRAAIPGREHFDHQVGRPPALATMPLPFSESERSRLEVFP